MRERRHLRRAPRTASATCASLMVPAPWARHAAAGYGGEDVGVHLTLNAEHELYRWGPITHAPSLLSTATAASPAPSTTCGSTPTPTRCAASAGPRSSGPWPGASTSPTSPPTCRPCRCGPSSSTCTSTWPSSSACPIRLPSTVERAATPASRSAAGRRRGRRLPRPLRPRLAGRQPRAGHASQIAALQPGVTEIHVQPAIDTPEVRALSPDAEGWIDDHDLVIDDPRCASAARRRRRGADRLPRAARRHARELRAARPELLRRAAAGPRPRRRSAAARTARPVCRSAFSCPA